MKKILLIIFLFTLCINFVSLGEASTTKKTQSKNKFVFTGWLPYFEKKTGIDEFVTFGDGLSFVMPFVYEVEKGVIKDKGKLQNDEWKIFFETAKKRKQKIIPTITWIKGLEIKEMMSDEKKRKDHISAILELVNFGNFDGIDIDYENKTADSKKYFSLFLSELSMGLHAKSKELLCTIEPRTPEYAKFTQVKGITDYANDYKEINKSCDKVIVMAYDQRRIDIQLNKEKGIDEPYVPVSDIDWVRKVIKEATRDIDKNKIILGIPTYGHEYSVKKEKIGYSYKRIGSIDYQSAVLLSEAYNKKFIKNKGGEASFTYEVKTPDGTRDQRYVTILDKESISNHITYARENGLLGASFFKIDGKGDQGFWGLVK